MTVPTPYYADDVVTLHHGDCLDVLRTLPDASVDAVVTDPPYGLEFMGKEWDAPWAQHFTSINGGPPLPDRQLHVNPRCIGCGGYQRGTRKPCRCITPQFNDTQAAAIGRKNRGFQEWCEQWARECLRVLKPGGHMLAFGGTRTAHRLACAVEDAGFELRDTIAWLYGSGFPKSLDVSKAIDKAAGAERPLTGSRTYADGAPSRVRTGTDLGVLNDDGWKPAAQRFDTAPATDEAHRWQGWGTALKPAHEPIIVARKPLAGTVAANVLTYGTGALNIDGCRVGDPDGFGGGRKASSGFVDGYEGDGFAASDKGRWPTNVALDPHAADEVDRQSGNVPASGLYNRTDGVTDGGGANYQPTRYADSAMYADNGGASRFFPTFRYEAKAPSAERPRVGTVAHPTVKPLDLMRWLVRLVTPTGGTVLEPFAGSGTTAEACIVEGFRCIAIEREPNYIPLILARITKPIEPVLFGESA